MKVYCKVLMNGCAVAFLILVSHASIEFFVFG